MLFHAFCEFADGSSKYLHLETASKKEAHRQAIQDHCASVVLWILSSVDPTCKLLGLEYTPQDFEFEGAQASAHRASAPRGDDLADLRLGISDWGLRTAVFSNVIRSQSAVADS
jgi:hypothetical protein